MNYTFLRFTKFQVATFENLFIKPAKIALVCVFEWLGHAGKFYKSSRALRK